MRDGTEANAKLSALQLIKFQWLAGRPWSNLVLYSVHETAL